MKRHGADMLWKVATYKKLKEKLKKRWHEGDTGRSIETDIFTYKHFCTQTLCHTNTFTHNRFYTQALLIAFTHKHFYKNPSTHNPPSHTNTFTHRLFYTQRHACTHKPSTHERFYTPTLLHTNPFAHRRFYTQNDQERFYDTHKHFYQFLHRFVWKGCRRTNQARKNPQFLTLEPHFVRKGAISRRLVGTACGLKREKKKKKRDRDRGWERGREKMCEDVQMWGFEGVKMWRWEDVKVRACEDVNMRRCEYVNMWGWEGVNMWRCISDIHFQKNPSLRRCREKKRRSHKKESKQERQTNRIKY